MSVKIYIMREKKSLFLAEILGMRLTPLPCLPSHDATDQSLIKPWIVKLVINVVKVCMLDTAFYTICVCGYLHKSYTAIQLYNVYSICLYTQHVVDIPQFVCVRNTLYLYIPNLYQLHITHVLLHCFVLSVSAVEFCGFIFC